MVNEKSRKKLDRIRPLKESCTGLNLHLYDFLSLGTFGRPIVGLLKLKHRATVLPAWGIWGWSFELLGQWESDGPWSRGGSRRRGRPEICILTPPKSCELRMCEWDSKIPGKSQDLEKSQEAAAYCKKSFEFESSQINCLLEEKSSLFNRRW